MKAFVVAALLVASVASQSFDLMDKSLYNKFNKPTHRLSTVEELLLKEKLGNQMMGYNKYNTFNNFNDMDLTHMFGGQQVNILSLEELVNIPLFREYMQIPTFRQFWEEYPVAMKKYVESPLFQQFWTVPQFQQYFRNPIFFYKYIVPQVQMISQTMYPTTEGIYNTPKYTPFMYNKYQPVYNREFPSTTYGQNVYSGLNYNTKYLLEKIYSHLNKKDVTETFTDVKMLPTGQVQEQTVGKIVDPITGEEKITVGDVKIVDEKIVPVDTMNFPVVGLDTKYQMDKIFGHHNTETIKDVLLKHIILNKIFGEKKVFTPEVYQTLFDKEEVMTPEIFNIIFTVLWITQVNGTAITGSVNMGTSSATSMQTVNTPIPLFSVAKAPAYDSASVTGITAYHLQTTPVIALSTGVDGTVSITLVDGNVTYVGNTATQTTSNSYVVDPGTVISNKALTLYADNAETAKLGSVVVNWGDGINH